MAKARLLEDRRPKWRDAPKPAAARDAPGHDKPGPSREVVFKVLHWHKANRAAQDSLAYIGRLRPQDDPSERATVYSDSGLPLRPDELAAELASWNLTPDAHNLSPMAKAATATERQAMTEDERLTRRQTMHGTLSFPRDGGLTPDQVQDVAQETFRNTFGKNGNRYVFAVHDEGDKVHVHVLVKVKGDSGGRNLRLGPADLAAIRAEAAKIANEKYRTNYRATPRKDRQRLRDRVRAGMEKLRNKGGYREAKGKAPRTSWIQEKAPAWYDRHGAELERRRAGTTGGAKPPPPYPARLPPLSKKTNDALEQHFARYEDPKAARQNFLELAAESRSYAYWAANTRPETFGQVKDGQARPPTLTQRRAPISRTWQTQANARIAEANRDEFAKAPERVTARRQAAELARAKATASRNDQGRAYAESVFAEAGYAPAQEGGGGHSSQDRTDTGGPEKKSFTETALDWFKKKKDAEESGDGSGHTARDVTDGDGSKKRLPKVVRDWLDKNKRQDDRPAGRDPVAAPTADDIEARAGQLDGRTRSEDGPDRPPSRERTREQDHDKN